MVETPVRAVHKYQTEKKKESPQDRAGRRTATATVAIALFTAVTVIVGSLQWCALHSTDEAIRGQLAEMQAEQRPWVYNKELPKVTKFVYLPNGNIHVEMTVDMVNVGKIPAQDVSGRISIKTGTFAADDSLRNEICTRAEWRDILGGTAFRGITIFPNTHAPEGLFDDINKDDITVEKVANSFAPYVVGCIAYRFAERSVYHHTPFYCILMRRAVGDAGIPLQRRDFDPDEFVCLRQPVAALNRAD